MLHWIRERLSRDDGVSIVETLVAILLVGFILMALAATTTTSLAAMHSSETQTRGTQLGNQVVEDLRSLRWSDLTFYTGDSPPASFEGRPTVITSGSRPPGSPSPVPSRQITGPDGIVYNVTSHVTWVDDPADGLAPSDVDPSDYKRLTVIMAWNVRGEPRSQRFDANRAAPVNAKSTLPFVIDSYTVTPDPIKIDATTGKSTSGAVPVSIKVRRIAQSARFMFRPQPAPGDDPPWTSTQGMTSTDGINWTGSISADQVWTEGYWQFRYEATSPAGEAASRTESVWVSPYDEKFVVLTNLVLYSPTSTVTKKPNNSLKCDVYLQFDVRSTGGGSVSTSGTWASGTKSGNMVYLTTTTLTTDTSRYLYGVSGMNTFPGSSIVFTFQASNGTDSDQGQRTVPLGTSGNCS